ncbi:hypothetical protein HQ531_03460 [bacterium]|nr:hypothetical protein [bacterium]
MLYAPSAGSRVNVYKVALLSPGGAYRVDVHVITEGEYRARQIVKRFVKVSQEYEGATVGKADRLITIVDTEALGHGKDSK